jgi:hypothetical protein
MLTLSLAAPGCGRKSIWQVYIRPEGRNITYHCSLAKTQLSFKVTYLLNCSLKTTVILGLRNIFEC